MRDVMTEMREITSLDCGVVATYEECLSDAASFAIHKAARSLLELATKPNAHPVEFACAAREGVIDYLARLPDTLTVREALAGIEKA